MGLFDYVRCHYPLPSNVDVSTSKFQTKSADWPYLENYEIRADGSLWHERVHYEDRSDPNAEGLLRLIGCQTSVHEGWDPVDWHGAFEFYDTTRCFVALYDHGKLLKLEQAIERGEA